MKFNSLYFTSIKSYQIALLGILIQIFLVPFLESLSEGNSSHGSTILSVFFAELSLFGIIPVLLLYFNITRKFGAVISIIIGTLPFIFLLIMLYLYLTRATDGPETLHDLLSISGIALKYTMVLNFLFFAGILYFWQERQRIIIERRILK